MSTRCYLSCCQQKIFFLSSIPGELICVIHIRFVKDNSKILRCYWPTTIFIFWHDCSILLKLLRFCLKCSLSHLIICFCPIFSRKFFGGVHMRNCNMRSDVFFFLFFFANFNEKWIFIRYMSYFSIKFTKHGHYRDWLPVLETVCPILNEELKSYFSFNYDLGRTNSTNL